MKKRFIFFIAAFLMISSVCAFSVEKVDRGSVVISELENPAIYDFIISSGAIGGTAELYSLVGIDFSPRGAFNLDSAKITLEVRVYPDERYLERPGNYIVEYYLKGNDPLFRDTLTFRVVSLKDALSISPSNLHPGDSVLNVTITNVENTNLDNVTLAFDSDFFASLEKISLKPYETASFLIPIDKARVSKLTAGKYVLTAKINLDGGKAKAEGTINYLEKQGTSITEMREGFIVRKTTITKKNEGNTILQDSIFSKKDIISRLFTISSLEPSKVERNGLNTEYSWTKQLMPSESWQVSVTTNYTWPFLFMVIIIIIVFLVKIYSMSNLALTKKVSYVRTKGGQFALKVTISAKARKHIGKIEVVDRISGMTKLYENYGSKPSRIDSSTRRIFWNVERMQAGEERVFSYIIYSSVNVVGRFELPAAVASYEREGKRCQAISNRAFFMSETNVKMD